MATTNIIFDEIWEHDGKTHIFKTYGSPLNNLWVNSFEDGIATVEPVAGTDIVDFAATIQGCFDEYSNFELMVKKAFGHSANSTFIGIRFTFNAATILITKANCDKIYEVWKTECEAVYERNRLEHETWLKTEEGQKYLADQKAEEARKKAIADEVLRIDETTEMEFKDEKGKKAWDKMVKINSKDPYGNGVVKYARRWAKYMQKLIAEGKTVDEIAKETSFDCDIDGITGFMYGCAVSTLAECWKWGEELRRWHNGEYGNSDSEGVINPDVLTIDVG